jgi:hypothetical protein
MKNAPRLLMAAFLLLPCGCSPASQSNAVSPEPDAQPHSTNCTANDVALSFDGADGDFNGMSHSGTYLVLTNKGSHACRVPRHPEITLLDGKGTAIPAKVNVPPGMHPGPVMTSVLLAPGAAARSGLRWVSGEVYDHNTCADIAKATVRLDSGEIAAPLQGHICGDTTVGIRFDEPWLQQK